MATRKRWIRIGVLSLARAQRIVLGLLTDFHRVPAEPETRQNHLSQTKGRTEAREEADGQDTQQIEEQADQEGIDRSQLEEGFSEDTNGEGTRDHVCR